MDLEKETRYRINEAIHSLIGLGIIYAGLRLAKGGVDYLLYSLTTRQLDLIREDCIKAQTRARDDDEDEEDETFDELTEDCSSEADDVVEIK